MSSRTWLCAGFFVALNLSGCAPAESLIPVEGKITLDGKPLTKGSVIFHPDASKGNATLNQPHGEIDPSGTYRLFTQRDRDGAPPGWYKVSVMAQERDPNDVYKITWITPPPYANHETSGIRIEVVEAPAPGAYDVAISSQTKKP
jgi:hypothetical protein